MDQPTREDLADTVGTNVGRSALLTEILGKVDRLKPGASEEDLDRWWGLVEIDRLASGLTLAAIAKLSEPDGEGDPSGPWLVKSDDTGDEPTRLTAEGKEAIRRFSVADQTAAS